MAQESSLRPARIPNKEAGYVPDEEANSRLERIMGAEGISRLASSTVMVLGLGGVGSSCVEALARGGVGRLVLVDRDSVTLSNLNRQAIAFHSTMGRRKVEVMREMVLDINPDCEVVCADLFVKRENIEEVFAVYGEGVDYVVDAIDTISAKLALARYAEQRGIPLVSSMGAANRLRPEYLRFADIHKTFNCPMCRIMRKEARQRGIKHLRVLFSCELPLEIGSEEGASRNDRTNLGTASYLPPIMGQMIAGDVICHLIGSDRADAPWPKLMGAGALGIEKMRKRDREKAARRAAEAGEGA